MNRSSLLTVIALTAISIGTSSVPLGCSTPRALPCSLAPSSNAPSSNAPKALSTPYAFAVPDAQASSSTLLEAEAGRTTGSVSAPSTTLHTPGAEASARRFVSLAPGQRVSWQAPASADSLVVRYSFPDSPDGGGGRVHST